MASGLSSHQAASRFGIGVATAVVWARRLREHGETSARCAGGRRGSRLDGHAAFIEGLIKDETDVTLDEPKVRAARPASARRWPAYRGTWSLGLGVLGGAAATRPSSPDVRAIGPVRGNAEIGTLLKFPENANGTYGENGDDVRSSLLK